MKTICCSCGKPCDATAKYSYCQQCETERNNPAVVPLVWEYTGGVLGSLPNRRGPLTYTLTNLGFVLKTTIDDVPVYVREDDGRPMGLIAVITNDNYIVIIEGKFEFEGLWPRVRHNLVLANFPIQIECLHPEHYDMIMALKNEKGVK